MAVPVSSAGCGLSQRQLKGKLRNETLLWQEPGLPAVNRSVLSYVPSGAQDGKPLPVVIVFHGWGGHAIDYHEKYTFGALAEAAEFLALYPEGLADSASGWTSWNAGDTTVEDIGNSARVCDPEQIDAESTCYQSCRVRRGHCDPCSWTTCYNDVAFVKHLLQHVANRFCVDLSAIFAYGCSNGGMFVHHLARRLPEHFRAVAADCGGKPHQGYERNFTRSGPPVSMLLLQGLSDQTIPRHRPRSTSWWDGYIYASDAAVVEAYKDYNRCPNDSPRTLEPPRKVDSQALSCMEYGYDCLGGTTVAECLFEGGHDLILGLGANSIMDGPELSWYFFCKQMARDGLICALPQGSESPGADLRIIIPSVLAVLALIILPLSLLLCSPRCSRLLGRDGHGCMEVAGPPSAEMVPITGRGVLPHAASQ